jgi:hypothetical protein
MSEKKIQKPKNLSNQSEGIGATKELATKRTDEKCLERKIRSHKDQKNRKRGGSSQPRSFVLKVEFSLLNITLFY